MKIYFGLGWPSSVLEIVSVTKVKNKLIYVCVKSCGGGRMLNVIAPTRLALKKNLRSSNWIRNGGLYWF